MMAIPLVGSPAPADRTKLRELLRGDNSNFNASAGDWYSPPGYTGGAIAWDNTFAASRDGRGATYGGSLKFTPSAIGQAVAVDVPGPFKEGQRYTGYILINTPDATNPEVTLHLGDIVGGSGDNLSLNYQPICAGTNAFLHWALITVTWMPTADRAVAQLMLRHVGATSPRIYRIGLALVRLGPVSLVDARSFSKKLIPAAFDMYTRYSGGAGFGLYDEDGSNRSVQFDIGSAGHSLTGDGGGAWSWSERAAGDREPAYEFDVGDDYLPLEIGEKSATELQLWPGSDLHVTLQDGNAAGATRGWRAADEAGNPTGLLSKAPWRSLAAAPGTPVAGEAYYDTTTNKLRIWDGTVWHDLW